MEQYTVIYGEQVTIDDIAEAIMLDKMVYDEEYHVTISQCLAWYNRNSQIYIMVKDNRTRKIVAYVNVSPVTDEYYEKIRSGEFIDSFLPPEAVVGYDFPDTYNLYFSSIVVHPNYQSTTVFLTLFNTLTERFLSLGKNDILIKRIVADAVSEKGEKFCRG